MTGREASGKPSLGELAEWGRSLLKSGPENDLDAESLLKAATGLSRERIYSHPETRITAREAHRYRLMVARRSRTGCPVAYLTGSKEFADFSLMMRRGVFIPRPETEGLVELALNELRKGEMAPGIAVDTCCGTGAVGIAIARQTGMRTIMIDSSPQAVSLARRNVRCCGVAHLAEVRMGRYLEPIRACANAPRVALITANPPYVPTGELSSLPRDIADFEPLSSLDGGPDGLTCVREIVRQACSCLMPGGILAMEIGQDEAEGVRNLLRPPKWVKVRIEPDLAGKQRYAMARVVDG